TERLVRFVPAKHSPAGDALCLRLPQRHGSRGRLDSTGNRKQSMVWLCEEPLVGGKLSVTAGFGAVQSRQGGASRSGNPFLGERRQHFFLHRRKRYWIELAAWPACSTSPLGRNEFRVRGRPRAVVRLG